MFFQGVFDSEEIITASVTYDADPYNTGKSDPHTYAITEAEDIAFLAEMGPLLYAYILTTVYSTKVESFQILPYAKFTVRPPKAL